MVEEGVASAEDIDNAMVLGYKHPTGPLRTTDIVGLDVRLGIAEYLQSTLGERFAPPQILARQGGPRRAGPQDRQGLLRLVLTPPALARRPYPAGRSDVIIRLMSRYSSVWAYFFACSR